MESNKSTEKNTPAKPMQNILLEKAVQGKFPFVCDSPFRLLPPVSTPPSRLAVIRNPFESQLTERLHRHVFSPSVFNNVRIAKTETEEKFKWTIEDISSLKPADIDEATVEQFEQTDHDPEMESTAQAKIEKFFSEKHIVPSPFDAFVKNVPLISESTSPIKEEAKQVVDGIAQTVLTLPPKLPEQIEAVLKPYFSYTVDQQRDETNKNNSLYRRLFEYEGDEEHSPTSVLTSPAPSCILSPIDFSPYDEDKVQSQRNFGSPQDTNRMSECNLSPINTSTVQMAGPARPTSVSRLNFSDRMSVDTSLNLVPDTFDQLPSNNQSLAFESMHSPVQELLSNSSVNWDMEYKQILFESPKTADSSLNENEMDVSTSNTPKSKIFTSQRKKLSDSFLKIEESDEEQEEKENIYEINCVERIDVKSNLFIRDETTDAGYQTGVGLTMSEESWTSSHLFASTPTKTKIN